MTGLIDDCRKAFEDWYYNEVNGEAGIYEVWQAAWHYKRESISPNSACRHPNDFDYEDGWPKNICADKHEISKKWVLNYLTDDQADKCKKSLSQIKDNKP